MSKKLINKEQGLVAITTTLVIMIIITLVITSFTLVVRREQNQSLDRQLSTQAFYAAESGIQDAINALNRGVITNNVADCTGPGSFENLLGSAYDNSVSNSDAISNVSYSCVLINRLPGELKYDILDPSKGTYLIPLRASGGNITNIRISWQNTLENESINEFEPSGNRFPQTNPSNASASSLRTGMPRVSVIPGSFTNRASITNNTKTMFLFPNAAGNGAAAGSANLATDPSGSIVPGNCNTAPVGPYYCNVDIATGGTTNTYYLAIRQLYRPVSFHLELFNGSTQLNIEGAQAVVDVTGRAEDVLRRIQVRVPLTSSTVNMELARFLPLSALETTDGICKQFEVNSVEYKNLCAPGGPVTPIGNQTITGPTGPNNSSPPQLRPPNTEN